MTKLSKLWLGLIFLVVASSAQARLIAGGSFDPSTAPDAWSVYGPKCQSGQSVTGCEVAVDFSGNFVPTVTNTQSLGLSSLVWSTVYAQNIVVNGNETTGAAGITNASGLGGTAAAQSITMGLIVNTPAVITGIQTSTQIPVNSSFETLMSTANTQVDMTSTPTIATTTVPGGTVGIPSGTYLILTSTGTSGVVLYDNATLSGSRLRLGAATRVITAQKTLFLIYDSVDNFWRETSFGNN